MPKGKPTYNRTKPDYAKNCRPEKLRHGLPMISKQLEKGLAKIGKSTVENRWKQAQAQIYIPSKKPRKDPALSARKSPTALASKRKPVCQLLLFCELRVTND